MNYEIVEVDEHVLGHFKLIEVDLAKRIGHKKFENPEIEKAWHHRAGTHGQHEWFYQVHIKTGHLGDHHHYTVLFEVKHGHGKVIDVHEGHKTLF